MEKRIIPITLGNDKLRLIISEIIESDPSLGEQITAFEDKNIKNKKISDNEVSDAVE